MKRSTPLFSVRPKNVLVDWARRCCWTGMWFVAIVMSGCDRADRAGGASNSKGSSLDSAAEVAHAPAQNAPTLLPNDLPVQERADTGKSASQRVGRIKFERLGAEGGVGFVRYDDVSPKRRIMESTGGGVAMIDIDADGMLDLVFTNGCPFPAQGEGRDEQYRSRIYRNLSGAGDAEAAVRFADVTKESVFAQYGYGQGCAVGDFDADGFDDLYITTYGRNSLWRNNGDGTFSDVTEQAGVGGSHWSTSCAFGDLNNDGHLDLYVANYLVDDPANPLLCANPQAPTGYEQCPPSKYDGEDDRIYLADGQGAFVDVTQSSGVAGSQGKALGVVIWNFDQQGLPEIFVANDGQANTLWYASGEQSIEGYQLTDRGLLSGVALSRSGYAQASMGIAAGDYDQDGQMDLILTHFYGDSNTVYQNQGGLQFMDQTRQSGLAGPSRQYLGWGAVMEDFDNDGLVDLFVANGHVEDRQWMGRGEPYAMTAQVFEGLGKKGFREVSANAGEYFQQPRLGRGVAAGDLSGDGRVDLAVNCQEGEGDVLINVANDSTALMRIELIGAQSNRSGIGCWVEVLDEEGGVVFGRGLVGGGSYQGASDGAVYCPSFGDGYTLRIRWPSGEQQHAPLRWGVRVVILEQRGIIAP